MNWNDFKAAILPEVKNLLMSKASQGFSWNGAVWNWSDEGDVFNELIASSLDQLDPEFKTEICKCDQWNNDDHLEQTEQIEMILRKIVWCIMNKFDYLFAAYQNQLSAQNKLTNFNHNSPFNENHNEIDFLQDVLTNNQQTFNQLQQRFFQEWDQLQISDFYNQKHQITTKERVR